MIKLNKPVAMLENILKTIEANIEHLQDKMDALEENACDHDRDMTAREQNKWDKYEEQMEELQAEEDEINNALDYLRDYTD
jgi:prefoldin subunit 5